MSMSGERFWIYGGLAALCGVTAVVVGASAGLWTFVQIVLVTELIHWIAKPRREGASRGC